MLENEDSEKVARIERQLNAFIEGSENAHPLVRFMVLVCVVDAAATCWCGRKSIQCSSAVFQSFVGFYLPSYKDVGKAFYNCLRCELVHNLTLGTKIALTAKHVTLHLRTAERADVCSSQASGKERQMATIINLEDFKRDVCNAVTQLFLDARQNVSAPSFSVSGSNYVYTFGGQESSIVFISQEKFDRIQKIESAGADGLTDEDKEWIVKNRNEYGVCHNKYDYIRKVVDEVSVGRLLYSNLLSAAKEIKPLGVARISLDENDREIASELAYEDIVMSENSLTSIVELKFPA